MTDPQVIVNLGTGGADLNGQNGSTSSADSNDARFLDWPGDNAGNYVYLPGVTGNYLSVPDEAALDITGDIDIRVRVAVDDWTPAAPQILLGKWVAGQISYMLMLRSNGELRFYWSTDGSVATSEESDVVAGITDGTPIWVRATLDVDNGAGGYEVKFYLSDDGASWTQTGTTDVGGSTTSIYAGTADVEIGAYASGINTIAGRIYRAQILDGIDGTTVLDVDTSVISSGSATSFTAVTGQTVTINRSTSGRKSVAVVSPVWLFGTDDYMEVADNALLDFDATDDFTVLIVARTWATPVSNQRIVGKFNTSESLGYEIRNNGTTQNSISVIGDGSVSSDVGVVSSAGTLRVYGMLVDRTADTLTAFTDGSLSSSPDDLSGVSSLTNSVPLRIGVRDTISLFADMEVVGVAVFRNLLTATQLSSIATYYQNRAA